MKILLKTILVVCLLLVIGLLSIILPQILSKDSDATYELRGRYKLSQDGKTHLVIEDNNGGQCGPLFVDKIIWSHSLNQKGEIEAGDHTIKCGSWAEISIKKGTTYYFDYWGP